MDRKPVCQYGSDCYRQNPEHLNEFHHPSKNSPTASNDTGSRKRPRKGSPKKALRQTKLDVFCTAAPRNNAKRPSPQPSDSTERDVSKSPPSSPAPAARRPQHTRRKPSFKNKPKPINRTVQDSSDEESGVDTSSACDVTSNSWVFNGNSEEKPSRDSPAPEEEEEKVQYDTPEEKIKALFLVDMPEDFYSFYEFCENLNGKNPKDALKSFGLQLVGPFDVLSGDMEPGCVRKEQALCHWRFYMDPPEMQTVLVGEKGLHYGYWRDEPSSKDTFVVSSTVPEYSIHAVAANLFGASANHLEGYIRNCSPFEKMKGQKVLDSLKQWAEDRGFSLTDCSEFMKSRKKSVVAPTFHGLGIVVPVDKKNDVGYRPLIETNANLKKMCQTIKNSKTKEQAEHLLEGIERLVNFANIANDECDFGNGLELGIDLFCMGSKHLDKFARHLLSTAYLLLDRPEFGEIIEAHLKNRRTELNLSVLNKK